MYNTIKDVREYFLRALDLRNFVTDKSGVSMVELQGATFIADQPAIFGTPSADYIKREIEWYESGSLYVKDIPGKTPKIWEDVSSTKGKIHSNYGYLINSSMNKNQYLHCLDQLIVQPTSRRAIMIYTRPNIQTQYKEDGMSDFICTNTVQYLIRNGKMNAIVNMRSNDVVFGYRNDYAWQKHVLDQLVHDYNLSTNPSDGIRTADHVEAGQIIWQVGSLHVYSCHFDLIK